MKCEREHPIAARSPSPLLAVRPLQRSMRTLTSGKPREPTAARLADGGPPGGPSEMTRVERPSANKQHTGEANPNWSGLAQHFGDPLIEDVRRAIAAFDTGKKAREADRAVRHFLQFLENDSATASNVLTMELVGGGSGVERPGDGALGRIVGALQRWQTAQVTVTRFKPLTIAGYAALIASTFEALGALSDRRYPRFLRRMVTIPDGEGRTRSLGELDWPELEGLQGAARERRALELVRAEGLAEFERAYALFRFGRRIMAEEEAGDGVDPEAWKAVRDCLLRDRKSWTVHGRSFIDSRNGRLANPTALLSRLTDRTVWERAGLEHGVARRLFPSRVALGRLRAFGAVVVSCLGPSWSATTAATTVLCCDTGWNRQPMLDLPRDPFVFTSRSEVGLASGVFMASFKRRAGHEVLAFLESRATPSAFLSENLRSIWRTTAAELDPASLEDGYRLLDRRGAARTLDLLDRYREMGDAIRSFDLDRQFEDRFFLHLTGSRGIGHDPWVRVRDLRPEGLLGREGVTFQAIRKTFLILKLNEVGSAAATLVHAGHRNSGSILQHYLNDQETIARLEQSTRFFQNACQAVLVRGRSEVEVVLGMSAADLDWYFRLAKASGIAIAAEGASDRTDAEVRTLHFAPTDDNLGDLYLAHLALRRACARMRPARWSVQGLPLLATVKAIGRVVCASGLRAAYRVAARRANGKLRAGEAVLPPVLGD